MARNSTVSGLGSIITIVLKYNIFSVNTARRSEELRGGQLFWFTYNTVRGGGSLIEGSVP